MGKAQPPRPPHGYGRWNKFTPPAASSAGSRPAAALPERRPRRARRNIGAPAVRLRRAAIPAGYGRGPYPHACTPPEAAALRRAGRLNIHTVIQAAFYTHPALLHRPAAPAVRPLSSMRCGHIPSTRRAGGCFFRAVKLQIQSRRRVYRQRLLFRYICSPVSRIVNTPS